MSTRVWNRLLLLLAMVWSSNCVFGQFIYLTNESNQVSAYSFNARTKVLTQAPGSPFATGVAPASLAVDSAGKFVYVANSGSGDISAYTINSVTGALSPVSGSPFATGSAPAGIAIDTANKFVYVTNSGSNDISAYSINAATGALTAVHGSPFLAGSAPAGVTIDPAGRFIYVTNSGSGSVSAYRIDSTTGVLTAVRGLGFAAGRNARKVVIDPTGKLAWVTSANGRENSVRAFAIDPDSGELTAVAGTPMKSGDGPLSLAVLPSGRFAYVADGDEISAYPSSSGISPSRQVAASRIARGSDWSGVVSDASGKFVYAANDGSNTVSVYAVDGESGALQLVAESQRETSRPRGIVVSATVTDAPAGTALITAFSPGVQRNNFTGGFGMRFTVGATPLTVTALGRIYIAGNTGTHLVQLVKASDGSAVPGGSVNISLPSGTAGEFAYASLAAPVTLDPNTSYCLLSAEFYDGDQFYNLGSVTATSVASVDTAIVAWVNNLIPVGGPNSAYIPVNLLYSNGTLPPSVAINAPASGATVSGNNVVVSATATPASGLTIGSVQFKLDNLLLGAPATASPYSVVLNTTTLSAGLHTLTAVATDSASNSSTSAPVSITVSNNPAVSITSPAPSATVSGSNVALVAATSAVSGLTIASVQFKVDNVALGAPVTKSPYTLVLDSTTLTNGPHSLVAVATDSGTNATTSVAVSFTVSNSVTTVVITSPVAGGTVSGAVAIAATATPGTGLSIAKVQFKIDNKDQGAPVTANPYSITLDTTALTNGPHSLSAVVTDSSGGTATSSLVSITVGNGGSPPSGTSLVTSFTSGLPRNNFTAAFGMRFTVGATPLTVTALGRIYIAGNSGTHLVQLLNASDGTAVPGGSVNISLPSGTAGQFSYASLAAPIILNPNTSYCLLSNEVVNGDQFYDLGSVTATNLVTVDTAIISWFGSLIPVGRPNTTYAPVSLLYSNGALPPTVSVSAPDAGATVSGKSVVVSATATAASGLTISSVQFKLDNSLLGAPVTTSPYSLVLDTTALSNGLHNLSAIATDSSTSSSTSAVVSFRVSNNPTVAITSPSPGVTVSGSNVSLAAAASAVTGLTIANVQFKVDNVAFGSPDTTSPYSLVLDSTKLTNGTHSLVAVATDSANNQTTSAAVSITVTNSVTTVVITVPVAGATISGSVGVTATATPATGLTIARVQFQVDNSNLGTAVSVSPYSIVLDTTTLTNGSHTLSAVVTDSSGGTATSSLVSITVGNGAPKSLSTGTPLVTAFTSGVPRNNFTGGFGMQFTVGATPLTVTALGRIYIAGNTGTHLVQLVNASDGSAVPGGSVNIALASGTAGQFTYASLATPVILNANTSYSLVSYEFSGGDQFYDLGSVTTTSLATVDTGIVAWIGGLTPVGGAGTSFVPVNLLYAAAAEASTSQKK